ncbi:helix-turn-helix domain-containing protein [Dellaglioa algida]|uniref:helix-turn-helix domain-containing protein n=1 Tax=Dellaglioa algida TaxID=105612 RepID=UPI000BD0ABD7|nr:helix-turn-helix transcriptional regulator [Dellaglioa algida]MDK1717892.1 helix-turn-helix transcriptional regulator [Dellaglioa algida]MDK1728502.1 helix-turn-helix transcriptional regulator [Dellaglioa algida]MDK1729916.1 helix-turn-helix transcriptional regulator [Dellaglioa algida]MDK1736094.1 helix-turn-helix transcriptional regulator [Dellaglioa algida]MDK1737867.1 helix-turn-helix transcriptional regulator [Dellaglioa algida]
MLKKIGILIRAKRKLLNMTIEQLAEKSKSSVSLISLIERGRLDNIKMKKLSDIAEALNMTLADFFTNQNLKGIATLDLINYLASLPEDKREATAELLLKVIRL